MAKKQTFKCWKCGSLENSAIKYEDIINGDHAYRQFTYACAKCPSIVAVKKRKLY